MSAGEATVNSDGTTNFEEPLLGEESIFDETPPVDEEAVKAVVQGIDPAVYLLVSVLIVAALYYFLVYRKKSNANEDGFFSDLDGDKVCKKSAAGLSFCVNAFALTHTINPCRFRIFFSPHLSITPLV